MGQAIPRTTEFKAKDYETFSRCLERDLRALKGLLNNPDFGQGQGSFGAELEVYLIDSAGNALCRNTEILAAMDDPQLTLELNRFNLEYNLKPVSLGQQPFFSSEDELHLALERIGRSAATGDGKGGHAGRIVPIGILPTLRLEDFNHETMTDLPRYHALRRKLQEERDGLFEVNIQGQDDLSVATDDITLEGANTSFQVHYRVAPDEFAQLFNAIQLVTPLVLAISSNSPTVFGKRLWHETRIPLFKKSIDCRKEESLDPFHWQQPARVNFGHGWVREGAYELFAETVRLYPPLLPIVSDESSRPQLARNAAPTLAELRLQQGTVWLWNRPVYDDVEGGHLRIEMRALPSGPTVVDMMANAALMIGLAEGLKSQVGELITALPFRFAVRNFYRAAQHGIDSRIMWPQLNRAGLAESAVVPILAELLPLAERGLENIGISSDESSHYLGIISDRLDRHVTGATWQLAMLEQLGTEVPERETFHRMLELYYQNYNSNVPVARWPVQLGKRTRKS